MKPPIISIDLAANPRNPTGVAVFENGRITTSTCFLDEDLIKLAFDTRPRIIGMDAPLSIPKGRISIEDRNGPHFRQCDLLLRERGIRFFPITIGAMRALTRRGMTLKTRLEIEAPGCEVVEIFPGASLDLLNLPRKDVSAVEAFLRKFDSSPASVHESDAAIGAFTLLQYSQGRATCLKGNDGMLVIASDKAVQKNARNARHRNI